MLLPPTHLTIKKKKTGPLKVKPGSQEKVLGKKGFAGQPTGVLYKKQGSPLPIFSNLGPPTVLQTK